jgi:hypothetical protein
MVGFVNTNKKQQKSINPNSPASAIILRTKRSLIFWPMNAPVSALCPSARYHVVPWFATLCRLLPKIFLRGQFDAAKCLIALPAAVRLKIR